MLACLIGCASDPEATAWRQELGWSPRAAEEEARLFPVRIHEPPELTRIMVDEHGPGIGCATCHSIPGIAPARESDAEVGGPHAGVVLAHGTNTCASCHDPEDRTALRLADGRRLPMTEAMTLCAQCHGPQYRDYERGSHGGMRGYWDRTRGPRERNHCIDCHDAHAPRYPRYAPMPPPRDRVAPHRSEGSHD